VSIFEWKMFSIGRAQFFLAIYRQIVFGFGVNFNLVDIGVGLTLGPVVFYVSFPKGRLTRPEVLVSSEVASTSVPTPPATSEALY
jgi:hypothetical protein